MPGALSIKYEALPADVIAAANGCFDTLGCALVRRQARQYSETTVRKTFGDVISHRDRLSATATVEAHCSSTASSSALDLGDTYIGTEHFIRASAAGLIALCEGTVGHKLIEGRRL